MDYNSRLKPIEYKGLCGDPEVYEDQKSVEKKVDSVAKLVQSSRHTVLFTGAGLSTSCGIPDFRGPNGVWTKEQRGEITTTINTFDKAAPSFAHLAIACLIDCGVFAHVVSQNVDGLHLRSGIPENKLSELHGNIFKEKCGVCGKEYVRDVDVGGMGLNLTGRMCDDTFCKGPLRDMTVDWDTELPKEIFNRAHAEHDKADLVICLGTSLRIRPAGNMPLRVLKPKILRDGRIGKLVIVNLQKTHLDSKATVKISYYCDGVMKMLCEKVGLKVLDPARVPLTAAIHQRYTIIPGSIAAQALSNNSTAGPVALTLPAQPKGPTKPLSHKPTRPPPKSKSAAKTSATSASASASASANKRTSEEVEPEDKEVRKEPEERPRKLQKLRDNNRSLYWDPIQ